MSNIPNRRIEGDVAVGRHVTAGGDATVRGSVSVEHDLRVKGWLEARNIKDSNKGLFTTLEKLTQAYPRPQRGWWALVGESLPADLYVERDGQWAPTGRQAGEPRVDFEEYGEALRQVQDSVLELEQTTRDQADEITGLRDKAAELVASVSSVGGTASAALDASRSNAEALQTLAEGHEALSGSVEGLAGRVEALETGEGAECPAVLPFEGFTAGGVEYKMQSLTGSVRICFDPVHLRFLGSPVKDGGFPSLPGGGIVVGGEFYLGGHVRAYNTEGGTGSARADRLFVDAEGALWRFDGVSLRRTGGAGSKPVVLTQAEYDALQEPQDDVLYYIVEREA